MQDQILFTKGNKMGLILEFHTDTADSRTQTQTICFKRAP